MLKAGETPIAIEFKSSIPMELLGKDGVMNLVSSGHEAKDEPMVSRSTKRKSSTPACISEIETPTPAAPAPTTITLYGSWPSSSVLISSTSTGSRSFAMTGPILLTS